MDNQVTNRPTQSNTNFAFQKWLILSLTVFCFLVGFIDRFIWAPIISIAAPDLGIDMTSAGMYVSIFYIGYVATQIPAGIMADRFGVRYLLTIALLLEGVSALGMAYIDSYSSGLWLRIISGFAAGTIYGPCVRSITTWFSAKERGVAFGIMMMAPSGGVLLANQIAPFLVNLFSWQSAFLFVGVLTIFLSVLVFFTMQEMGSTARNKGFIDGLKFVFSHRELMLMSGVGFCLMWMQTGFISWGNTALENIGFSLKQGGQVMAVFGLGGLLGPVVSGYLMSRLSSKSGNLMIVYLAMVPLLFAFGASRTIIVIFLLAFLIGLLNGYANTFLPLMVSEYSGELWAASAGGVSGSIFQIASIFGPVLMGSAIDLSGSFHIIWWILGAGLIVGCLLLAVLKKTTSGVGQSDMALSD